VGPASVINTSCEYSRTIWPKETNGLSPKSGALTLFRDELYISLDFDLRVYRVTKLEKRQKEKNHDPKIDEIGQNGQKSTKNGKKDPAKPMKT
jgi:hypothetical protein